VKAFLLAATLLSPTAPPQAPAAGEVLGIVRTGSGRLVDGAQIRFCGDSPGIRASSAQPTPAAGRTGSGSTERGGRFRFDVPTPSGTLWVTTEDGLGAIVAGVQVGAPVVVTVEPLAAVQLDDGSEFRCLIQALAVGQPPSRLDDRPTAPSAVLRLPAGRYLMLVGTDDSWVERTIELRPGDRETIPTTPPDGEALPGPVAAWFVDRWAGLPLPLADGLPVHLGGPDVVTRRSSPREGIALFDRSWFTAVRPLELPAPQGQILEAQVKSTDGGVITGCDSSTWSASPGGLVLLAECHRGGDDGTVPYWAPSLPAGSRVLFSAPRHRPASFPIDAIPQPVVLEPSAECRVRVRLPGLRPARIVVREPGDPCVTMQTTTDPRGMAVLPHVPTAAAEVTVTSPGSAPLRATFDALGLPAAVLELAPGLLLRGLVHDADGQPAPFCEVEVRDPSGTLLDKPRRTVSDDRGSFVVEGLADGTYTIWVRDSRDGRTYSGQTRGAQPGRDVWEVTLRDEDPKHPGRG
jgi:hypothetical protein